MAEPAQPGDDWYEDLDEGLEQGDVLVDFPLVWVDIDPATGELGLAEASETVVVLTQTCDIPKDAQSSIMVAQAIPFQAAAAANDHFKSRKGRQALRDGTAVAELLLPPSPGYIEDFLVVAFRNTFVLPKSYVFANVGASSRRLRSPYKEHLAQGYARFMMRVGLPRTLHGFE